MQMFRCVAVSCLCLQCNLVTCPQEILAPPVTPRIDPPFAGLCLSHFSHGFKRLRGVFEVARLGEQQLFGNC